MTKTKRATRTEDSTNSNQNIFRLKYTFNNVKHRKLLPCDMWELTPVCFSLSLQDTDPTYPTCSGNIQRWTKRVCFFHVCFDVGAASSWSLRCERTMKLHAEQLQSVFMSRTLEEYMLKFQEFERSWSGSLCRSSLRSLCGHFDMFWHVVLCIWVTMLWVHVDYSCRFLWRTELQTSHSHLSSLFQRPFCDGGAQTLDFWWFIPLSHSKLSVSTQQTWHAVSVDVKSEAWMLQTLRWTAAPAGLSNMDPSEAPAELFWYDIDLASSSNGGDEMGSVFSWWLMMQITAVGKLAHVRHSGSTQNLPEGRQICLCWMKQTAAGSQCPPETPDPWTLLDIRTGWFYVQWILPLKSCSPHETLGSDSLRGTSDQHAWSIRDEWKTSQNNWSQ